MLLLCDIIHDIYDVIFSVIFRLSFCSVSKFIKVNIFGRKILIMYLTAILTHDKIILDQSHKIAAKIPPRLTRILDLFITKDAAGLTLLDQ